MAYSDFTLVDVQNRFNLTIIEVPTLFPTVKEASLSPFTREMLAESSALALSVNTEKARSEFIIAPILIDLRKVTNHRVNLFSGIDFKVAPDKGLTGVCDFVISRNNGQQMFISAPILIVVEAKNENIGSGMGQCIATMYAAQIFNKERNNDIPAIYGVVTSGNIWKFLKLENTVVQTEEQTYYLNDLDKIFGILNSIVEADTAVAV
jgi:hypothetical protein